jgi:hypothetical protein
MSEPTKIVFGLLSTYEREGWIHPSITQFFCDLPFVKGHAFRVVPIHNFKPAAAGRNVFCREVKNSDADWICMIDNDMHINGNLLDVLKDVPKDASIVVPKFYMWNQAKLGLTLCWGMDDCPTGYKQVSSGWHELSKCGTGVIFIKPEVIKAMEYPYFKYIYNADCGLEGTEDVQFCLSARAKGFKIYGNASFAVGHFHSVELGSMWSWAEKAFSFQKSLDSPSNGSAVSAHKDSGRSPDRSAIASVPASAQSSS